MHYDFEQILETIRITEADLLDIRTVTMGISLRDCYDRNIGVVKDKIYSKIIKYGKNHVRYAKEIELKYGVSIQSKIVSVTPVSIPFDSFNYEEFVEIAKVLDQAAGEIGIDFISGYSALVQKGITHGELELIKSIPYVLAETTRICSSVNVASTAAGINMNAVNLISEVIKKTAELTKFDNSIGCAKFAVYCNIPEDNPFIPGAFHGISEPDCVMNTGISGAGVVLNAIKKAGHADLQKLVEVIKKTAFKITRAGELIGRAVADKHGIPFGVVDISLTPAFEAGDSLDDILKAMGIEEVGAPGTTACLAMLNNAIKKAGIMASSSVGGMSALGSKGSEMIAIPGEIPTTSIAGMIADECTMGMVNNRTTCIRIIPVYGKKVGESVDFGGHLGKAQILQVSDLNSSAYVLRGGRIPAPEQI